MAEDDVCDEGDYVDEVDIGNEVTWCNSIDAMQ